jgi:cyclopropane-fatty-acyl-phospholipid synthase
MGLPSRFISSVQQHLDRALGDAGFGLSLELPGGATHRFGRGDPVATIVAKDARGVAALGSMDVVRIGEAYLSDSIDIAGDLARVLSLRAHLSDRHPLLFLRRWLFTLAHGQVSADKAWIAEHYDEDPAFFELFLDRRHRAYSQGVFEREDEPLEDAITRKLEYALAATGLRPGDRVLDIGGGWGAFTEFAGKRGIRVTSLTISDVSRRYIQALIDCDGLPCEVRFEHFLEHQSAEPYDAVVNLGVTEHLPDYPATLARYHALLRPGARVYLDASASRIKYQVSSFTEKHLFPGNGSPLCLRDYLHALSTSPLELERVVNDRESYLLTCQRWAENLDRHRADVEARWGVKRYRQFRIYLWGCVDGFRRDIVQAYRLVLRRPTFA